MFRLREIFQIWLPQRNLWAPTSSPLGDGTVVDTWFSAQDVGTVISIWVRCCCLRLALVRFFRFYTSTEILGAGTVSGLKMTKGIAWSVQKLFGKLRPERHLGFKYVWYSWGKCLTLDMVQCVWLARSTFFSDIPGKLFDRMFRLSASGGPVPTPTTRYGWVSRLEYIGSFWCNEKVERNWRL